LSQVVFPVPRGPNRKKDRDGSRMRRAYMASILTVKMLAVYTKMLAIGRPLGLDCGQPPP
jgi:hypothetical protein